jgi:hypothetical protein
LCYALRNKKELWDGLIYELSNVADPKTLLQMYEMATSQKHSLWYVNLRRLPAEFYINFDEQLIPERKPTDEPPEEPGMTSFLLTKHDGTIVEFPVAELAQMLAHLVAVGNTRCQGRSGVTLLSAGGMGLLLVDTSWHIGRRLVETYTVVSEASFPFGVVLQQGSSMFTLSQALAGAGHVTGAITDLAQVYMAQYTTKGGALTYVAASSMVLDEGSFQTRTAKIRRLLADATWIQATEGEDDVVMAAGLSLLALATTVATHGGEIEMLRSETAGMEASLATKVEEEEAFDAAVAAWKAEVAQKADQTALDLTNAAVAMKRRTPWWPRKRARPI